MVKQTSNVQLSEQTDVVLGAVADVDLALVDQVTGDSARSLQECWIGNSAR